VASTSVMRAQGWLLAAEPQYQWTMQGDPLGTYGE
jgi:hypothetical protein